MPIGTFRADKLHADLNSQTVSLDRSRSLAYRSGGGHTAAMIVRVICCTGVIVARSDSLRFAQALKGHNANAPVDVEADQD